MRETRGRKRKGERDKIGSKRTKDREREGEREKRKRSKGKKEKRGERERGREVHYRQKIDGRPRLLSRMMIFVIFIFCFLFLSFDCFDLQVLPRCF